MDLRIVRRLGKQTLTEQELVEGCKRGDDLARKVDGYLYAIHG